MIGFYRLIVYVSNTVSLVYGALLLIQRLARLDEEMCRSATSTLPTRLAAKLWQARTDPGTGMIPGERAVNYPTARVKMQANKSIVLLDG